MRIDPNMVPQMLANLQQSQSLLDTALQEVSTGLSVNEPSDNPTAAASMVQNTIETGDLDVYTQNVGTALLTVQSAGSVLSSVVTSLTSAVSAGTEGANGTNSSTDLQALAQQVQAILTSVVSAANTSVSGSYLFGGTSTATPYTANAASPTGYTYNGNNNTNSVAIGDQTSVQINQPGSQIFSNASNNVIGSLSSLVTALKGGNSATIETATASVDSALNYVSGQQVFYGNAETQLNSQETFLQQDKVTLSTQANNLVGVNESTAATDLSQAETDNSAALAAVAKVLPNSLLNFLEPPA
jgi:flagellar hook-associated protein 3 FlgL